VPPPWAIDCELGVTATVKSGFEVLEFGVYVQVRISWVAVLPPVPAVKPTNAVLAPTRPGILTGHEVVKVSSGMAVSVIVMVSVVPS